MKNTLLLSIIACILITPVYSYGYLPDPPENATKIEVGKNFTEATHYFWVDQDVMYVQVVPKTERFYACGLDWSVIQDSEYMGYMKFATEAGTSYCADLKEPQTFIFTNWSFFPTPDYTEPMTLVYTGNDDYNSTFQFPEEPITTSYDYYVPYYISSSTYWTGVALTNLDDDNWNVADVTLFGSDGWAVDSQRKSLLPKGQTSFVVDDGGNSKGWIKIESTRELAGLAFTGQKGTSGVMVDVPFMADTHKKMVLPHAAFDDTWDTLVYLANPNDFMADVTLTFHDTDGEEQGSVEINLFSEASEEIKLSAICQGKHHSSGSIHIESDEPIAAFAIYSNSKIGGKSAAGIAATPVK